MRIRYKYFLVLLAFSLIPLVVVTHISRRHINRLGTTLAQGARENLTALIIRDLEQVAKFSAGAIRHDVDRLRLSLHYLGEAVAHALQEEQPSDPLRLYFPRDYAHPDTAPPDLAASWRYRRVLPDGKQAPTAISMDHPTFVVPADQQINPEASWPRLAAIGTVLKRIYGFSGSNVHRVYFGLANGVHVSYPGHGHLDPAFDPRQRPWYRNAVQHEEVSWLSYEDVSTGRIVFTAGLPITGEAGQIIGVAAIDILPEEFMKLEQIQTQWSDQTRALLVMTQSREGREGELWVIARGDLHSAERGEIADQPLAQAIQTDPARLQTFARQLQTNNTGFAEMPNDGVEAIWAFARIPQPIKEKIYLVLIVPQTIVTAQADSVSEDVLTLTDRIYRITGIAAGLTLLLVILVGWLGSRTITQPLAIMLDAWRQLARGDFSVRINTRTGDERDSLAEGFNTIVPKLEAHFNMSQSMALAREIQQNLLPHRPPELPGLDFAGDSRYCDETGGDYYDVFKTGAANDKSFAVIVGDVSGHGVPAALLMTGARSMIRSLSVLEDDLAARLTLVNRLLYPDTSDSGSFITLFYLEIDMALRRLRWVRAGHDPAMVYDPETDRFSELSGRGAALGIQPEFAYAAEETPLGSSGQIIVIATDGIWEAHNPQQEMFGKARVHEVIRRHCRATAATIRDQLFEAVAAFSAERQEDDLTLAVIKIL
ncbi:MAG: SpoIIE family protein phosphatase [Desulfobacterales bacterium]|nr:SpoIIE family protein phosphatase [Desulfobacterales bacterium]